MTLLEAAIALAKAREAMRYLRTCVMPSTVEDARRNGADKAKAYRDELDALDALDAAYRHEEYGEGES